MNALESIIAWAESDLPKWQSDAVRRLLVQDTLTEEDRQEVLSMLKALHGLLPEGSTPPKPLPLHKGMVSGAPKSTANVILKAVKSLSKINKIPDGSFLQFGHKGITAIYGENGSGKSGYARVLKRACRARDTQERILPNVYRDEVLAPATATFKVSVNEEPDKDISWEDGKPSNDILTHITVFDSKCARVIVDEKNEATYLPYGTHVFEDLVDLLKWIRQQIEGEKPKQLPLQFTPVAPTTKSGIFLAGLTHKTKEKDVEIATSWTDYDAARLEKTTRQLAELEAHDPLKQAASLRSFKERLSNLRAYVEQLAVGLSDERLATLKSMMGALAEAELAVKLSSQATLKDEPLPHAGESAWQILFAAAKEYSTKYAYPSQTFPFVGDSSRCVFCMQVLSEDAKERLLRFAAFMEQAAKKKHEEANKSLGTAIKAIEALKNQTAAQQHKNTISELKQRDEVAADATLSFLATIEYRLKYIEQLLAGNDVGAVPSLPLCPLNALTQTIDSLEQEAAGIEKNANPTERDKLKIAKEELLARKCLAENRAKILAYIADLRVADKCAEAIAATDTYAITKKGRIIVSAALTPQLKTSIEAELVSFGAHHLPLNLKPTGSSGETLHQLELKGTQSGRKISLSEVLSEGEQRVVALAGFLAEIGLGQHNCPIVFDDPVSSLDHRYRSRIAERLVLESKKRQVLIFTHDITFLLDLQEKAGELEGTYFTAQTVLQKNEAAGIVSTGLPWHAMPVKERLKYLRDMLGDIKALYSANQADYDRNAAYLYSLLRETWEAAIEETLLNKTVVRHGNAVQTLRLKEVGVTTEQYKVIDVNMSRCSTWMVGHDKSKKLDVHRPAPAEVLADIDILNKFVEDCKKVGKALRAERDAALGPAVPEIG